VVQVVQGVQVIITLSMWNGGKVHTAATGTCAGQVGPSSAKKKNVVG
jgi:hypothetical protein